jgi:replicative DNA helicase
MQDCERQLLAAWISGYNQDHIKEFDSFTYYPEIFDALKRLKKIDILTVSKETRIRTADIAKLTASYMPSLYDTYYRQMKEEKIKAMLLDLAKEPDSITQEKVQDILNQFDSLDVSKIKDPTDLCEAYKNEIEKRKTAEPLKYGLPTLDYITGGIRRQELTVISARPRIGKTALSLQIGFSNALKKKNVLFLPLEMAGFQLMERLVCKETKIKSEKLKTPKTMTDNDEEMLKHFFELYGVTIKKYLHIIEGVSRLSEIKRHVEHYKPDLVIIDQLSQLRENKRFNSKREEVTYMTNTLKAMTMELDVPIILLAQINRDGDEKEPTLRDLKESGSIEEDADNVIMIHRTAEPYPSTTAMQIIVRKQRNGASDIRIDCVYENEKYTFREIKK